MSMLEQPIPSERSPAVRQQTATERRLGCPVFVDAHVHCHDCAQWRDLLDAACRNFRQAAQEVKAFASVYGCLLMTESHGVDRFAELRSRQHVGEWTVSTTDEAHSLICHRSDHSTIVVVAGRQIITRERLEVLAVACERRFLDGQPIVGTVQQVNALGGLPIVPWGFGKWWLCRRRVLRRLLATCKKGELFLGDNGGRARLSPRPCVFARAEAAGILLFPGSDPLPFPSEVQRVGGYGFVHDEPLDPRRPASSMIDALRQLRSSPQGYGNRVSLLKFVTNQLAMQYRKKRWREKQ